MDGQIIAGSGLLNGGEEHRRQRGFFRECVSLRRLFEKPDPTVKLEAKWASKFQQNPRFQVQKIAKRNA